MANMNRVTYIIIAAEDGVPRIGGATNVLAKSNRNIIIHVPQTLLIKYLKAGLKSETKKKVVDKIFEVIKCLDEYVRIFDVQLFVFESWNVIPAVHYSLLKILVKLLYGCTSNRLHNLSVDIGKLYMFSMATKRVAFVSK